MRGLRNSSSAASRFVAPRATIAATCRSWRVSSTRSGATVSSPSSLRACATHGAAPSRPKVASASWSGSSASGRPNSAAPLAEPQQRARPFERCFESGVRERARSRTHPRPRLPSTPGARRRARRWRAPTRARSRRPGRGTPRAGGAPRRCRRRASRPRSGPAPTRGCRARARRPARRSRRRVRGARSPLADGRTRARGTRAWPRPAPIAA